MRHSVAVAAVLLSVSLAARADTVQSFSFTSTLNLGYTAQGIVVIDTTTGVVDPSSFTLSLGSLIESTFTTPASSGLYAGNYLAAFAGSTAGYTYELLLPVTTLVGYTGGSVCTNSAPCAGFTSGSYVPPGSTEATANSGSLTAATAVTPEPSGLALLGTGLLGIIGVVRKRFA